MQVVLAAGLALAALRAPAQSNALPSAAVVAPQTAPPSAAATVAALDGEALLRRAREALRDELYPFAEKQFGEVLAAGDATAATREDALAGLAAALIAQRRAGDAVRRLSAPDVPPTARLACERARAWLETGDATNALASLAQLPADMPRPLAEDALRLSSRAKLRSGDVAGALADLAEFERRYADSGALPGVMLEWAAALMARGRSAEAVPVLERLRARHAEAPESITGRLWLGRILVDRGEGAAADPLIRPLAEAAATAPADRAQAWLILAAADEARTNLVAALASLDRGLEAGARTAVAAELAFAKARVLIRAGRWDDGRALLRETAQQNREHPAAAATQLFLAQALLDAARPAEALEEFQRHLETFADPVSGAKAQAGKGWCLLALDRPAEAADAFAKAAAGCADPLRRQEAEFKTADAWFAAGRFDRALELYRRFSAQYPKNEQAFRARFQAAECRRRGKDFAGAEQDFLAIEHDVPGDALAAQSVLHRVLMREEQGQWKRAAEGYDELLRTHPGSAVVPRALLGRGLVAYRLGAFEQAHADFQRVVAEHPGDPAAEHAFFMRGWCHYLLGRDDDAVRVCREFIAKYPSSVWTPDVQFWLGEHAFNRGQFAESETAFARLATDRPKSPLAGQALYRAGRSAMAAREYLQAIEHFNRLAKDQPQSPFLADARFAQGDALSELGQFAGAILAFDETIKLAPDSYLAELAWGRKGDCHFTLGADSAPRYEQALICYQAVRNSPKATRELQMQAEYKMGRCLERMGRPDDAFERYMAVVYAHLEDRRGGRMGAPLWFTRAAFNAAALKEKQDQWREAVNVYRRVVEDGGAASAEAQDRIQKIRFEKWMLF